MRVKDVATATAMLTHRTACNGNHSLRQLKLKIYPEKT
jgi:hypothetical protein